MDKENELFRKTRAAWLALLSVLTVCVVTAGLFAQNNAGLRLGTGEEIFKTAGCIAAK